MQKPEPMSVVMSRFTAFLESELGAALLAVERQALSEQLSSLVGNNCIQLSVQRGAVLCPEERFAHLLRLGYAPAANAEVSDSVWADYEALPVANDCVDVAVLHHVLEFAEQPHQVLREATRTLTEGGHLLIVGFNPFSLWPMYRRFYQWRNRDLTSAALSSRATERKLHTIRQGRLADWLSVLNYDIIEERSLFYRPPLNSAKWLARTEFCERFGPATRLPIGLAYVTLARARNIAATPIVQGWRRPLHTAPAARVRALPTQQPAAMVAKKPRKQSNKTSNRLLRRIK